VTASIPRLDLDDLEPSLAAALRPRVERLGYLGEFFRCAGHQPGALRAFMEFTDESKGGLPERLVELIALTAACQLRNDYERNQHERLSVRLGFGREWVEAVERLQPDDPALSAEEQTVQRYVLAATDSYGHGGVADLEQVVTALGPAGGVAVMMVLGRYVTHALIVNSLELKPPVPSIFEDGFDG
jgi:alkylhydroperoxidase family enzyme